MAVTPKHLCQEFEVEPAQLRAMLRMKYGKVKGRWNWDDREASRIRRWLGQIVKPRSKAVKSTETREKPLKT